MSHLAWWRQHEQSVHERLKNIREQPDGVLFHVPESEQKVMVLKEQGYLYLYFCSQQTDIVQSRMRIDAPLYLLSPYSQLAMMCLAICPEPKSIYIIGLGGGRIPLFLQHLLPHAQIHCSEIDPAVAKAAAYFGFLKDDRTHISIKDGRAALEAHPASQPFDMIFVDAFGNDNDGPRIFSTVEFFTLCRERISAQGVVIVNLLPGDTQYAQKQATVVAGFPYVYSLRDSERGNKVFFGCLHPIDKTVLAGEAARLEQETPLGFDLACHVDALVNESAGGLLRRISHTLLYDDVSATPNKLGRNDPCHCGSGKKYKKCHGA